MFRSMPDPEPTRDVTVSDELIPLSVLSLDMPEPGEGWSNFLGRRAIAFRPDDLGRNCVRRQDARRLLDEKRADELRAVKRRQLAEQEAVEQDRVRFAQIWRGVSADDMPPGVHPAAAMLQASRDARPKRQSPLEAALSNSPSMEYQRLPRSAG